MSVFEEVINEIFGEPAKPSAPRTDLANEVALLKRRLALAEAERDNYKAAYRSLYKLIQNIDLSKV